MNKLEEFKEFVRRNPFIKTAVDSNKITWQKAYETYDLFGAQASEFGEIRALMEIKPIAVDVVPPPVSTINSLNAANSYDIIGLLSSIDYNKVSNTIDQLQKMIGVVKDLSKGEEPKENKARKIFKRYND